MTKLIGSSIETISIISKYKFTNIQLKDERDIDEAVKMFTYITIEAVHCATLEQQNQKIYKWCSQSVYDLLKEKRQNGINIKKMRSTNKVSKKLES